MTNCRFCGALMERVLIDLGSMPLANSYLEGEESIADEESYPLRVMICSDCYLVQINEAVSAKSIFIDYKYFSSYSSSWLEHAKSYAEMAVSRFGLNKDSFIVELASNDGYLLKNFVELGFSVVGIEPASNVAKIARELGIPTITDFFGITSAENLIAERGTADLIIANNVLAHVPDINDFVAGVKLTLSKSGTATFEFPHLMHLVDELQFDTIYHEHFSYLSLFAVENIFARHGLKIYDVEKLPTHGGSLRLYVAHDDATELAETANVGDLRRLEMEKGISEEEWYSKFEEDVKKVRSGFIEFVQEAKKAGKKIAAYGAAAKGNTFLNYCGIDQNDIEFVADLSDWKQGLLLPGSHIPVLAPDEIKVQKPDYVVILPWNLEKEIVKQISYIRDWGGLFVIAVPELRTF